MIETAAQHRFQPGSQMQEIESRTQQLACHCSTKLIRNFQSDQAIIEKNLGQTAEISSHYSLLTFPIENSSNIL